MLHTLTPTSSRPSPQIALPPQKVFELARLCGNFHVAYRGSTSLGLGNAGKKRGALLMLLG